MSNLPAVKDDACQSVINVSPKEVMAAAAEQAKLLKSVVDQAGLAKKLGGKKEHLEYEAWALIAKWNRCSPNTEWTRPIKDGEKIIGWEARVQVLNDSGTIIGAAENMCMADEPNWRNKPQYSLRSMAQTRTASKALRMQFSHVAVLAGYSPTPVEEMDGVIVNNDSKKPQEQTEQKQSRKQSKLAQLKKSVLAEAVAVFGDQVEALKFIKWNLETIGEADWTEELLQNLLDNFAVQAAVYREESAPEDLPL